MTNEVTFNNIGIRSNMEIDQIHNESMLDLFLSESAHFSVSINKHLNGEVLTEGIKEVFSAFKEKLKEVWEKIKGVFKKAFDAVKKFFENIKQKIKEKRADKTNKNIDEAKDEAKKMNTEELKSKLKDKYSYIYSSDDVSKFVQDKRSIINDYYKIYNTIKDYNSKLTEAQKQIELFKKGKEDSNGVIRFNSEAEANKFDELINQANEQHDKIMTAIMSLKDEIKSKTDFDSALANERQNGTLIPKTSVENNTSNLNKMATYNSIQGLMAFENSAKETLGYLHELEAEFSKEFKSMNQFVEVAEKEMERETKEQEAAGESTELIQLESQVMRCCIKMVQAVPSAIKNLTLLTSNTLSAVDSAVKHNEMIANHIKAKETANNQ